MKQVIYPLKLAALVILLTGCTASSTTPTRLSSDPLPAVETTEQTIVTSLLEPVILSRPGDSHRNRYDESINTLLLRYDLNQRVELIPEVSLEIDSVKVITTSNLKAALLDDNEELKPFIHNDSYRSLVFTATIVNSSKQTFYFKGFQEIRLSKNKQPLVTVSPLTLPHNQLSLPQTTIPLTIFETLLDPETPETLEQLTIITFPLETKTEEKISPEITFALQLVNLP